MRVINRTAVTILGAQPYIDWTRKRDADFAKGTLTVARTKGYGSAFREWFRIDLHSVVVDVADDDLEAEEL